MSDGINDGHEYAKGRPLTGDNRRVDDENKTPEMMLQIDHKRAQHEENYRRAEAFLLWKLGTAGYDEARRFLRGSGMDWPSLFVEFCEKVEEQLLARMSDYDKVYFDNLEAKAKFGPFTPQTVQLTDAEVEALSKDWPGIRVEAGQYEWTSGKALKDCKKEKDNGERQ